MFFNFKWYNALHNCRVRHTQIYPEFLEAMADEESPRITVTVKTPKEKHDVEINQAAGVQEVRIDC